MKSSLIEAVLDLAQDQTLPLYPTPKYGGTVFLTDPDNQGSFIGGVFSYADHVSVEFSKGAAFDDPDGHLEGKGKGRRHIKLRALSDLEDKDCAVFMAQAIAD